MDEATFSFRQKFSTASRKSTAQFSSLISTKSYVIEFSLIVITEGILRNNQNELFPFNNLLMPQKMVFLK